MPFSAKVIGLLGPVNKETYDKS